MTPVLYAANETQFNSMGIGVLADTISAHVTEERNGAFELEFVYPVDGPLFGELQKDRIVKAKANDDSNMDPQLFRIYYISKLINGQCTYKAEHVSYELGKNPITSVNVTGTAQQFMNTVLANTLFPHRFSAISDDQTSSSSSLIRVSAREAFGGTTGSLIQIWGGELTFDNWLIRHSLNRGTDTGIIVGYGKNLTDLNQEEAIDQTYTSIYPYATVQVSTGEGEDATTTDQVIELPEKYVESPYVGNYAYGRCLPVDLSGDDVTNEASLRAKAQQYIISNEIGKPTVNLTVSFINLWQTEEYKSIAPLEHINLCDYVTVRFKKLGVDVKAKVIKTDYDVLAERYLSVELGDPKSNLADDINSMQSSIADVSLTASQAAKVSGYALIQANGKNKTYFSATEPTGNLVSGDLWYKIVNGQYTEMWRYNGISWNKILSADANDALNKAIDALTAANGKNTVYHQAAQPIAANNQDIWFRENADGTVTIFVYQDGQWTNPIQDGVKAAQDQADTAVATADAASAQASNALNTANSASGQAATAINTANSANSAASAAQQTASNAYTQASSAWNNAQTAMSDAQSALDNINNLQIGGRNLLLNSGFSNGTYNWAGSHGSSITLGTSSDASYSSRPDPNYGILKAVQKLGQNYAYITQSLTVKVGQEYTISGYVYADSSVPTGSNTLRVGVYESNSGSWINPHLSFIEVRDSWSYFSYTFTSSLSSIIAIVGVGGTSSDVSYTVYASLPKLENGNKPTAWSPAPEDVQVQIGNINGTLTQKVSQDLFNTLAGTVSSQATLITQNQSDVALKANKDYVDTINQTVSSQGAQITANAQAITQKADSSTVNALTGQVSTMSATLTTQANQIAARITSQDADAKYATQTALTATSSSLTSQISSVQTNLNNLQVGGTNLIPNSDFSEGWVTNDANYQNAGMFNCSSGSFSCDSNGFAGSATPANAGNTGFIRVNIGAADLYTFMQDNQYIWQSFNSSYTNCRAALTISRWQSGWGGLNGIGDLNERTPSFLEGESSTSIVRFTLTVYAQDQTKPFSFSMSKIKAETGNKCTDWSNASFDMATVLQFTSLSQTLSGFQTTVQQDYATKSLVTQTATSLQSSIDGKVGTDVYNSKVSQLSNDINARVVKNDVVHQINISTEGILIDGSKTHITGQTTIDNAVITNAMIASIDIGKATTGTLDANRIGAKSITVQKLDVANLAAISANLGAVTAGNITASTYTTYGVDSSGYVAKLVISPSGAQFPLIIDTENDPYAHVLRATSDGIYTSTVSSATSSTNPDGHSITYWSWAHAGVMELKSYDNTTNNIKNVAEMSDHGVDFHPSDGSHTYIDALFTGLYTDKACYANSFIFPADDEKDSGLYWTANGISEWRSNGVYRIRVTPSNVFIGGGADINIDNNMHIESDQGVYWNLGGANIRGNQLSGLDFVTGGYGIGMYLGVDGSGHKNLNVTDDVMAGGWAYAANFVNTSRVELKQDITALDDNIGLSLVNSLDIYKFKYKKDVADGRAKFVYGGIIGDGYSLPDDFKDFADQGVNLYSSTFIGLKAIQELTALHQQDVLKIAELESRISLLEGAAA
jgi:phage minor structural protein